MATLCLKCKTCKTEFASGFGADKKSFETMQLSGNGHTCPKGHTNSYDKKDYYLNSLYFFLT